MIGQQLEWNHFEDGQQKLTCLRELNDMIGQFAYGLIAFGGDRGTSRVEISFDDGGTWQEAKLDYPGTKLTWALWSYDWRPPGADNYTLVVRATDGEGEVQELDEERPFKSGPTGFHRITVYVT